MIKIRFISLVLIIFTCIPTPLFAASVFQDANRFTYGFSRAVMAPFKIPLQMLVGTARGPMFVGTVGGALRGTAQTVTDLVGGGFDMAAAAAPYAKYAVLI